MDEKELKAKAAQYIKNESEIQQFQQEIQRRQTQLENLKNNQQTLASAFLKTLGGVPERFIKIIVETGGRQEFHLVHISKIGVKVIIPE